jgi:ribosomal-protein-alanine N-acetyltransferase
MATRRQAEDAIQLRQGGADDLDNVMRVMAEAFQPCFGEGWTRSQCAGILPMGGVRLTVADGRDGVQGFSLARTVADEAELLLIAVAPASQGRGIGLVLVQDFIAHALSQGAHRLHLEVRDGNPAVHLYRDCGFVTAGRRRNYYRGPEGEHYDALTLILAG